MTSEERAHRDRAFERHRIQQMRRMAQLPLTEKLQWLEDAQQMALHLQKGRVQSTLDAEENEEKDKD